MPDEYKIPTYYYIYSIAEVSILVLQTTRDHHMVLTELTIVEKDKQTNNGLPTCTVGRLLKPACILLIRIFQ